MENRLLNITFSIVVVVFIAITISYAATETEQGDTVTLSSIAADWTWSGNCRMYGGGRGTRLNYILWSPGSADDVLVIKEQSPSGPQMFYGWAVDRTDQHIIYYHGSRKRPVIDYSECTLSTGSLVIFELWPQR